MKIIGFHLKSGQQLSLVLIIIFICIFAIIKIISETPFGKVPVLYIDGIPLCENGAIVRYLASLHGLNGESLLQQAFVEMAAGTLMDVFGKIPYMEQDEEKKVRIFFK